MKQIIFLSLIIIFTNHEICAQTIHANEARRNYGKTLTVEGKVYNFELTNNAKTTILYITRDFPYHDLSIIINDNRMKVKQHPELFINGKTISVKGYVFNWYGQPSMKVAEWGDITIKDAPTKYSSYMNNTPEYKPLAKFKKDTLAYIFSNFVFNAGEYVNKPLDSIVKKSELPIRRFGPMFGRFGKRGLLSPGTYLYFYNSRETDKKVESHINPGTLYIIFKQPMPGDSAINLIRKYYPKHDDSLSFYYKNSLYKNSLIDSIGYIHYHFRDEIPKDTSLWPHYPVSKKVIDSVDKGQARQVD
jgi:hypothetical protein